MNKIFTFFISGLILASTIATTVKAQDNCEAWIPRDGTFSYAPFTDGAPPYYRNDDGSTAALTLPFNFCMWGQNYSSVYINTNGNISFGAPYSTYSPDSFPSSSFQMIAPFWADVYLLDPTPPGSNVVIYKIQPHYMIVQWDSVAYYSGEDSIFDSFQVIISDGTDPIIPHGNNVSFAYRKMQWTTGNASSGFGGFGGYPATVGANEGDDIRYIQMGLFDQRGSAYLGQFPPPPNYDGVAWLDYQYFIFNLCAGSIAPIVSGVTPCDTFKVCVGDSINVPFYFFTPVQGDSVWSRLPPPIAPGVSVVLNHPGHTDSLIIKIVGSGANEGYHTVNVYGYDNATPEDTTYTSFVVEVDSTPRISLTAFRDSICAGDTSTLTAFGGTVFSWSNGATTSSTKVWPATSTIYTIGVSNNGGCIKDSSIKVTVVPKPSPSIRPIPADTICQGDTVMLIGSGGIKYTWSNGKTTDSVKVVPTLTTTIYTLTASNGICSDTTTVTIKMIPKITASIAAVNDTVCPHGASIITATGIGGQATYKWNTGATTSSISVNDTVTTTYTVTVYGICDSVNEMKTVTVIPLPKPVISGTLWKCKGSKDTLTISSSVNPTTYLWSNGRTSSSYYTGAIDADSTIYVTAENSLGCSVTDSFRITVRQYPSATLKYSAECGTVPDTIKAVPFGTGPFTYQWSTGGTYDTINVTVPDTTTFTVVISNGCPITKTVTIIPYFPSISACCNATINIGNDTVLSASGADIVKYQWIPNTGLNCDTCANVIATPTVTTTYTVIGTDAQGCTSSRIITINVEVPCFVDSIPNVFTPTNAGPKDENSMFYITTQNLTSWSILVYDRWGKEIFKTTNPKNYWDGNTESGGPAPAGVYYYIINATCPASNYKKQGYIQLIR